MDAAFVESVRETLATLAAGGEPGWPAGGGLARVFRQTGASAQRAAVGALAGRWFRQAPEHVVYDPTCEPFLNRPDVGESEKLYATLAEHVVGLRRWQELSSNESTFYRYRRAAIAAFTERLWTEVAEHPLPTNRPAPEYVRFIGRQREVATLLRLLGEPGGAVVGVEGPGGSGKTALLHAVADACEAAARRWQAVPLPGAKETTVPVFDAIVWVARTEGGSGLSALLEAVVRTLDYPGLLARALEDRRQAVRDLVSRRAVLLVVDDVDRADPAVLAFLADLPSRSRGLVAGRRRLPSEVRALMPEPLAEAEVHELLLAEAERQGMPELGRALAQGNAGDLQNRHRATVGTASALAAAARYPLLAGWAVGQLRRGQTVERVRERLARAEGEVFGEMFAASIAGLSPAARQLLATLPILAAPTDRAALLAAGVPDAPAALDELLETSLLEVRGGPTDAERRYELHAVTRGFVSAHLPLDLLSQRRVVGRLAEHYSRMVEALGGAAPNWRSFGRLEPELPNIMALVEAASLQARDRQGEPPGESLDRTILRLAHGLRNVFSFGGAWSEGLVLFHRAIEAARRLDDARAEGWNRYRLGALHYELGSGGYAEAALRAREAAELLRAAGDQRGWGHAVRLLGRATRARGNLAEAERLLGDAEELLSRYGHGDDVAIVRASRADLLRLSGRLEEASALYLEVLAMGLEDPATEANVRKDLGEIALQRDDRAAADTSFAAAEQLAEAAGARAIQAHCRLGRARLAQRLEQQEQAVALASEAADLFERLGDLERAYEARALG
jgi:tetratricopeptide (TPR) repeat protein